MSKYYDAVQRIERLHRSFLDVLKVELDRQNIQDINNVQAMILYNIGDDELTVGELTARGYYLGSNVSYSVKKMVEGGYLDQERSVHDKRSIRVKASEKGTELRNKISDMIARHEEELSQDSVSEDDLTALNATLASIGRFWDRQIRNNGAA